MLLITHRPEGLDLVDEIVSLDDGRVVERRLGRGSPGVGEPVALPPS